MDRDGLRPINCYITAYSKAVLMTREARDCKDIFWSAVRGVDTEILLAKHLHIRDSSLVVGEKSGNPVSLKNFENLYVIGAGKASGAMAATMENLLGNRIKDGIIAVKEPPPEKLHRIRYLKCGHPVPDANSIEAGRQVLQLISGIGKKDLVFFLLSGGASSLLADHPEGITLSELQHTFDLLLRSGATIHEVNCVRKHLSNIKGGQLLAHFHGLAFISFIISDVIADDLTVIGSGPATPDTTYFKDALEIILKYQLGHRIPHKVIEYLTKGSEGVIAETPKANSPLFERVSSYIIGSNHLFLKAAEKQASDLGYRTLIITNEYQGEAKWIADKIIRLAGEFNGKSKICLLAGGESTVTVTGNGKGGRNQELALEAAMKLSGSQKITILVAGSDGSDGPTTAAGAIIDGTTCQKEPDFLLAKACLENNDSFKFFENRWEHFITGPTFTNVMDIIIILIG
jgi:glycerate 2-kinase